MSFRTIIQSESVESLRWKAHARQLGKGRSKRLGRYRSTIGEAWMAARRCRFPRGDPAVQTGQRSTQQRGIVNRVERKLTTDAICGTHSDGWKSANGVLCTSEVVAPHCGRLRGVGHVDQIRMDESGIPTPVFCRGIGKDNFRHLPTGLHAGEERDCTPGPRLR